MLGKLDAKTFLRIGDPLHRSHGNSEFTIAKSAGANCRDCPKPFEHPKSALFHVFLNGTACSTLHFKKGKRVSLAGCHDQKTLKLVRTELFTSGVTKIAVLK